MRKILLGTAIAVMCIGNLQAQSMDEAVQYGEMGLYGTPRFQAMGGAFTAVGGDITAMGLNPAGTSVFTYSNFYFGLGVQNTKNQATGDVSSSSNNTNVSSVGGAMVFKSRGNSSWNKFALGFVYDRTNNFNRRLYLSPNSDKVEIINDNGDSFFFYDQIYDLRGYRSKSSFTFGAEYNEKFNFGIGFNFKHNYLDQVLEERDEIGTYGSKDLTTFVDPENNFISSGNGFSFTLGFLARLQNFRLGASFESPSWYNVAQDLYDDKGNISESFQYDLTDPLKLNIGAAYVFEKYGLLSFDYTYKNLSRTDISNSFGDINNQISTALKAQNEFRIGAEARINIVSLRAGYKYVSSPFKQSFSDDFNTVQIGNMKNYSIYSMGLGVRAGNWNFDGSYAFFSRNYTYNITNFGANNSQLYSTPVKEKKGNINFGISYHF